MFEYFSDGNRKTSPVDTRDVNNALLSVWQAGTRQAGKQDKVWRWYQDKDETLQNYT